MIPGLTYRRDLNQGLSSPQFDGNLDALVEAIEGLGDPAGNIITDVYYSSGLMYFVYADTSVSTGFPVPSGLQDVPQDGKTYARKFGLWVEVSTPLDLPPNDNAMYGIKNGAYVPIGSSGGGISEAPTDGQLYGRRGSAAAWAVIPTVPEYPAVAGPVGRITRPARLKGVPNSQEFDHFTLPDGYCVPAQFSGTRAAASNQATKPGPYGAIVSLWANPRGWGPVDTGNDLYLGRFVWNLQNGVSLERNQGPPDGYDANLPIAVPAGSVIAAILESDPVSAEWISIDVAFDPA